RRKGYHVVAHVVERLQHMSDLRRYRPRRWCAPILNEFVRFKPKVLCRPVPTFWSGPNRHLANNLYVTLLVFDEKRVSRTHKLIQHTCTVMCLRINQSEAAKFFDGLLDTRRAVTFSGQHWPESVNTRASRCCFNPLSWFLPLNKTFRSVANHLYQQLIPFSQQLPVPLNLSLAELLIQWLTFIRHGFHLPLILA